MLAGGSLAVVLIANDNPWDASGLVGTGNVRNSPVLARQSVFDTVGRAVLLVQCSDEHVVGDVVQVSAELQPGSGHGDVVGGALALGLDQDQGVVDVLPVPLGKRREQLQPLGILGDDNITGSLSRGLVGLLAGIIPLGWEVEALRSLETDLASVGANERVLLRVEGEVAGDGHGRDNLRRRHKRVRGRVGIVTCRKVPVERRHNRIGLSLGHLGTLPLADAWPTRIRQDGSSDILKDLGESIPRDGRPDLLATWADGERHLGLDSRREGLLGNACCPRHVLIRRVGAGTNQSGGDLAGPAILLDRLGKLGDTVRQIRRERTVDLRLKLAQIDLDNLVVLGALVRT
mmetsp:Transcript_9808/g.26682  ORF Transcript_9808/g.26682 Transcript_9808/m.26682 type:complete len:346 (-) Transcript_9808:1065-2102(-)